MMAIAPMPVNAECLRRTFSRKISEGRVLIEEKAAWNVATSLDLATIPENSEMSTLVLGKELGRSGGEVVKVRVQAARIDSMVQESGLARVNLIKMDIEGAERHAIERAALTVKTYKPRLSLASYHLADDVPVLTSLVMDLRPDYVRRAGGCIINRGRCVPESLFFQRLATEGAIESRADETVLRRVRQIEGLIAAIYRSAVMLPSNFVSVTRSPSRSCFIESCGCCRFTRSTWYSGRSRCFTT